MGRDAAVDLAFRYTKADYVLDLTSFEISALLGIEISFGTIYTRDGIEKSVFTFSGIVEVGELPVSYEKELHIGKGHYNDFAGPALQLESSFLVGTGVSIPLQLQSLGALFYGGEVNGATGYLVAGTDIAFGGEIGWTIIYEPTPRGRVMEKWLEMEGGEDIPLSEKPPYINPAEYLGVYTNVPPVPGQEDTELSTWYGIIGVDRSNPGEPVLPSLSLAPFWPYGLELSYDMPSQISFYETPDCWPYYTSYYYNLFTDYNFNYDFGNFFTDFNFYSDFANLDFTSLEYYADAVYYDATTGEYVSLGNPVVLDLDGTGLSVTPLTSSNTFYDMAGDGYQHRTAWAGVGNGVLVLDLEGDGQIAERNQVIFTDWDPSASSDMQALANVFDTNNNGKLDAGDDAFASFKLLVTNADGTTTLKTLAEAGVESIDLTANAVTTILPDGSEVQGEANFTRTDGSTGQAGTVSFAYDSAGYAVTQTVTNNADGSTTINNKALNADGSLAHEITTVTSADGLSRTIRFDRDGDGVIDQVQTIDTVIDSDGSKTETLTNKNAANVVLNSTITATSADQSVVSITRDTNGNGAMRESW